MKKYLILISIAILSFSFISCDKETAADTINSLTNASMSATVDGAEWKADTRVTRLIATPQIITILGASVNNEELLITVRSHEAGNYTSSIELEDPSAQVGAVWRANNTNYYSKGGTVNITELDKVNKKISGTFSFDMISTSDLVGFAVASGSFSKLSYTEEDTE